MKILFVCGSVNQTQQMAAIAAELPEHEHRFSPYYSDGITGAMARAGLAEMSIGGVKRRGWCLAWLREHRLPLDVDGREGGYDLVVTCSDVVVPRNIRGMPMVAVQEGILDPERVGYWLCKTFPFLPHWIGGTSLTGQSGLYDRFCAASAGYRDHLIERGADPAKIAVTGIPNFDDCRRYLDNSFPHRGFVLVCTSDARETLKIDFRARLLSRARAIANGRKLIFKLHPNEDQERATREIAQHAPEALVFASGSAEEMIANCDVLITQWSSTAFVGIALGKEVHSNFDAEALRRLCPVQNGGASARNIAQVCREVMGVPQPQASEAVVA
jgi:hypothetical protein